MKFIAKYPVMAAVTNPAARFKKFKLSINAGSDIIRLTRNLDFSHEVQLKSSATLPALERQLKRNQTEINNVMNAIKQGIITSTTKSALEELECEEETLALSIARERIERPVIGKEDIRFRLVQYADIDLDDPEQSRGLSISS